MDTYGHLLKNYPLHQVNPQHFWRDTLRSVAPIALLSGLAVAFTYWVVSLVYPGRESEIATLTVMVATFFGVHLVFLVSRMLGVVVDFRAKIARVLYAVMVGLVITMIFVVHSVRDFFDFTVPEVWLLWPAAGVILATVYIQRRLAERAGRKFEV